MKYLTHFYPLLSLRAEEFSNRFSTWKAFLKQPRYNSYPTQGYDEFETYPNIFALLCMCLNRVQIEIFCDFQVEPKLNTITWLNYARICAIPTFCLVANRQPLIVGMKLPELLILRSRTQLSACGLRTISSLISYRTLCDDVNRHFPCALGGVLIELTACVKW
jgi:hypothetical protein